MTVARRFAKTSVALFVDWIDAYPGEQLLLESGEIVTVTRVYLDACTSPRQRAFSGGASLRVTRGPEPYWVPAGSEVIVLDNSPEGAGSQGAGSP